VDTIALKHSKQGVGKGGKTQQIEKLMEVRNVNLNPTPQCQSVVVNTWKDANFAHPPSNTLLATVPSPADIRRYSFPAVQWHGYSHVSEAPSGSAVEPPVDSLLPEPMGYNTAASVSPTVPGKPTEHGSCPAITYGPTAAMDMAINVGDGAMNVVPIGEVEPFAMDGADPPNVQGQTDGSDHYAPQEQYDETESIKAHSSQGALEGRIESIPDVIDLLDDDDDD